MQIFWADALMQLLKLFACLRSQGKVRMGGVYTGLIHVATPHVATQRSHLAEVTQQYPSEGNLQISSRLKRMNTVKMALGVKVEVAGTWTAKPWQPIPCEVSSKC